MYVVTRQELELAKLDVDKYGHHHGLNIGPDTTEVTDGTMAIRVKLERIPEADYPVPSEPLPNGAAGPVVLGRDEALALVKAIPKKATIPVLTCAVVASDGAKVTAATTDLGGWTRKAHDVMGTFPNVGRCLPLGPPAASTGFDPKRMRDLLDALIKLGVQGVRFDLYGDGTGPMKISGQGGGESLYGADVTAVLMPQSNKAWEPPKKEAKAS